MSSPHLYLLDGSSSLYRAFFGLPPLRTSRGIPTNAVYGFTTMLFKILRRFEPLHCAVVFDAAGPTTRHGEYAAYKANRPAMPDDLGRQIPYVYRILEALRIPLLTREGWEADDILATIALKAVRGGYQVTLITGDKDFLQLVGEGIRVYDPVKDLFYGPEEVRERYGVPPEQLVDFMGLVGDSVDNIPGVPGVGEKTARALITEFGTVENLLAHLDRVTKPKLRETLRAHAEQARLSRSLVQLRTSLPLEVSPADLARGQVDTPVLQTLFRELEFTRLLQTSAPEETVSLPPEAGSEGEAHSARPIAEPPPNPGARGRMLVVGVTGGIGTGKSTVARMLRERGAYVVDADAIAHALQAPGRPAYTEIVRAFGPDILQANGEIDRQRLGARVFADPSLRKRLEAIMHPAIAAEREAQISRAEAQGARVCVLDAALLFETGAHRRCDTVIVVTAREEESTARLATRSGLSPEEIVRRRRSQLPLEEKVRSADYVVDNSGSHETTAAQVERIWEELERVLAEKRA